MIKLYNFPISGNAYKVRLLLSFLKLDYELIPVDMFDGEHKTETFLKLNPRGQVPVLVDNDVTIWDSQAILIYLARKYGDQTWLPIEAEAMAEVMQWMAVSENELLFGLARARAVKILKRPWDLEQCQEFGHSGLTVLESRLKDHEWLAGDHPTIADIACYPYVFLAPDGEVELDEYVAVQSWLKRFEGLPAYVGIND